MDTKLKAEPWVERTGSEPTKAQKERKHKSRVQQKMRQRENRKLVARGEEGKIVKPSLDWVTLEQANNALRREAYAIRKEMEGKRAPKADIEAAVNAIINQPTKGVMEKIVEERRERRIRAMERGTVNPEEAEEPREGDLDEEEEFAMMYGESLGSVMDEPESGWQERPVGADDQAVIGYDGDLESGYLEEESGGKGKGMGRGSMSRNGGQSL